MERSQFTLRISPDLVAKLLYIAEKNSRTLNGEVSMLMKIAVSEFEKEHGIIKEAKNAID